MSEIHDWRFRATVLGVAALATLGTASCSGSASGGGGQALGVRETTGPLVARAQEAGAIAAKQAGAPVALQPKTIGILNIADGIESADRLVATIEMAADRLGWKTIKCDGKGTPSVFVTCGDSLLAQGVDGIAEIAIEPGQIQPLLDKAKSQGAPVIQVSGGAIPLGDLDGSYGSDEAKSGKLLADALIAKLKSAGGSEIPIAVHDYPAAWATTRTNELKQAIAPPSPIKVVANTVTDVASMVAFTRKTAADQLVQNPNLKAFWFSYDAAGQAAGQVVASEYGGKVFPNRPLVATFHADLGTTALMRKGEIDLVSEVNYDAGVWIGMDNMAEFFARNRPMMKESQPKYPVIGDGYSYKIITKGNLPPLGQYVASEWDIPTYFTTKWRNEFGR